MGVSKEMGSREMILSLLTLSPVVFILAASSSSAGTRPNSRSICREARKNLLS